MHNTMRKALFRVSTKLPLIIHSHCQNWGKKVFQRTQSTKYCGERSEREAKKRGQIKGCLTPHAWEMSLAFKMFQVWQMLRAAKWLITGTEKAQDEGIGLILA